MEITRYITNRFQEAQNSEHPRLLVGICGRAGSGKTSLAGNISSALRAQNIQTIIYEGDWRFSLDSSERKLWIEDSMKEGIHPYSYSINQYNWWDFARIQEDLQMLMCGKPVKIDQAYNRDTGKRELSVDIPPLESGVILFENAILGGVECLRDLAVIVLLNTSDVTCFQRTIARDKDRRSIPEIATRYLITTHSENIFLRLLEKYRDTTVTSNDEGKMGEAFTMHDVSHIPLPIEVFSKVRKCLSEYDAPSEKRS